MMWDRLRNSSPSEILAWAEDRPWSQAMARCAQDERWHTEGDVWTHTKMVCAQLSLLKEWTTLTPHERTVLLFTALFHDSGKPETSAINPDSGRITSPNHAVKGARLARSILRELACDVTTREEIVRMVRFHGRPAFLIEKPHPSHEVVSLSWLVSNRLLYLFALSDTRGRTAVEMTRPEDNLHLWWLVAEENGCFDQPYAFGNDHARFLFYRQEQPSLHYVPYERHRCTITLMSGLPGSGKDTWLAANRADLPVVSLDDIRGEFDVGATDDQGEVIQVARERCRELLRLGRSFAFDATNTLRQTRRRWIDLFADYDARIEIVYLEPPLPVILNRNARRDRPVPEGVIRELCDKCEPPTLTEAHALTIVCDDEVCSERQDPTARGERK